LGGGRGVFLWGSFFCSWDGGGGFFFDGGGLGGFFLVFFCLCFFFFFAGVWFVLFGGGLWGCWVVGGGWVLVFWVGVLFFFANLPPSFLFFRCVEVFRIFFRPLDFFPR